MGISSRFIAGTKGSHVVVDHPELRAATGSNEFFFENKDGRIMWICPMYDRVLVGTSDIKIEDPDDIHCTDEEVEYFLELVTQVFPSIKSQQRTYCLPVYGRPSAGKQWRWENDRSIQPRSSHRSVER